MHSMMRDRRGPVGRLMWWTFWVLLILYVVHRPSEAAVNARALIAWLTSAAEEIAVFLQHLAGRGQ